MGFHIANQRKLFEIKCQREDRAYWTLPFVYEIKWKKGC